MSRTASTSSPDRRKLILWIVIVVVVVAVIVGVGLASRSVVPENATTALGQSSIKVGDTAPAFSVQTNAGPFDLATVPTPVLLEVFATWCPHCQRETATMNDLASKYSGKVAIVAVSGDAFNINHDGPESQADVNAFAQKFGVRYPIAYDPGLSVAKSYLKDGYPTLVVIDKDKKVRWIDSGEKKESEIVSALDAVVHPAI